MNFMNTPVHHGPPGLAELAEACAHDLFSRVQHEFRFPLGCSAQNWPVAEIKAANEELLRSLRNRGNVYTLFVRAPGEAASWTKMYVGERKGAGLRDRITQHIIVKHPKTGSMLEEVKTAVSGGAAIGLSFIKVQPESLRLYVEEAIIAKHKTELPWNSRG